MTFLCDETAMKYCSPALPRLVFCQDSLTLPKLGDFTHVTGFSQQIGPRRKGPIAGGSSPNIGKSVGHLSKSHGDDEASSWAATSASERRGACACGESLCACGSGPALTLPVDT